MKRPKAIKVLIVEDDALVSEVIRWHLSQIGHVVIGEAADGDQAVDMARSLEPDVVLMDIQMPNVDGIEATRRIQRSCPTPVVVLTAYETPEWVERAGEAGVGAYLVKPASTRDIERAITIAISRFQDMMALQKLNGELQARNEELQRALATVRTLKGLLPICASCKKIRDDKGYWQQVETYIQQHSDAEFSHGLCPDCRSQLYPRDVYPFLYEDEG